MRFEQLQALGMRWTARLSGWLALYPEDDPMAPVFRARQIHAALRITPLTMVANLLNALLVGATFWDDVDRWLLGAWVLLVALFVTQGLRAWWRHPSRPTASRHAINRSTMQAALLALAWGVLIVTLIPGASSAQQLLLAIVASGMMSAGGLALATLPMADGSDSPWHRCTHSRPVAQVARPSCSQHPDLHVWPPRARSLPVCWRSPEQQHQIIGLLLRVWETPMTCLGDRGYLTRSLVPKFGAAGREMTAAPLASLLAAQPGGVSMTITCPWPPADRPASPFDVGAGLRRAEREC
jgi:hypothetical protein